MTAADRAFVLALPAAFLLGLAVGSLDLRRRPPGPCAYAVNLYAAAQGWRPGTCATCHPTGD